MTASIIRQVITATFGPGKELRSQAYRNGVMLGLELKLRGLPFSPPRLTGTASDDAMEAGMHRAAELWDNLPEEALIPPADFVADELPPYMDAPTLTQAQAIAEWEGRA